MPPTDVRQSKNHHILFSDPGMRTKSAIRVRNAFKKCRHFFWLHLFYILIIWYN